MVGRTRRSARVLQGLWIEQRRMREALGEGAHRRNPIVGGADAAAASLFLK